jgi:hypothetical protein
MSMKSPAGVPPASAKKASGGPTAYELTVKYMLDRMPIAQSMDGGKRGYKFDCMCPCIWYSFYVADRYYITFEFLTWYAAERDIECLVSDDGMFLHVHNKILENFISQQRIEVQFARHIANDPNDLLAYQAANQHFKEIQQLANRKPIQPIMEIPLPFQCQKDPYCPYDHTGMRVLHVPHEYYTRARVADPQDIRKFQIISVTLVAAMSHRNTVTKENTDINF